MSRGLLKFIPLLLAGVITGLAPRVGFDWPLLVLGLVLVFAVVSFLDELERRRKPGPSVDSFDPRPADGHVPLVPLVRVVGAPNTVRPEIQSFRSLEPNGSKRRSASVRHPLKGRVGVFSLFVGRDGCSWDDREIVDAYKALDQMGRWLEREAAYWKVPLNLERIETYFVADDPCEEAVEITESHDSFETVLDDPNADVNGVASASRAAARLGFGDLADLISQIDSRTEHDATIWVIHLLRSGRSSAITADRFEFPGVGVALCYARESAFSEPLIGLPYVDPVTLAHEILHLFGATDKYGTPLKSFPPRSVTSHDVMRLDKTRLGRLRIDPLTATELGWLSRLPKSSETKNARHQREVDAGRSSVKS